MVFKLCNGWKIHWSQSKGKLQSVAEKRVLHNSFLSFFAERIDLTRTVKNNLQKSVYNWLSAFCIITVCHSVNPYSHLVQLLSWVPFLMVLGGWVWGELNLGDTQRKHANCIHTDLGHQLESNHWCLCCKARAPTTSPPWCALFLCSACQILLMLTPMSATVGQSNRRECNPVITSSNILQISCMHALTKEALVSINTIHSLI